jgi:large subunit ribosomal protein L10e
MRKAFGKPYDQVTRVSIGQAIASVRVKDQHKEQVIEALRRAKFKFPGRQKVLLFITEYYPMARFDQLSTTLMM